LLSHLPAFAALAPRLDALRWEEAVEPSSLTRHERAGLELGPLRLALHFTTEQADTHAGPIATARHQALELTEAGVLQLRVERTPPGPLRAVLGPPTLAALLDGLDAARS
jgi:hypothetical protein